MDGFASEGWLECLWGGARSGQVRIAKLCCLARPLPFLSLSTDGKVLCNVGSFTACFILRVLLHCFQHCMVGLHNSCDAAAGAAACARC